MKKVLNIFCLFLILCTTAFSGIKVAQEGSPRTFDPHFGNDGNSLRINRLIYSRLVEKDSNMNIIPGVAESWKFLDEKNIEFKIRDNIFFQNGEKLDIEDIKFSFQRMKDSPRIASILPPIKDIKVIDEKTFIMELEKPFSSVIDQLSHPALSIVSKDYVEKDSKILLEKPMGTGPYQLKEWNVDENLILTRNEKYFGEKKDFDEIEVKIIPLASNRTIALETGEVDIAFSLPIQDKKIIEENKNLEFITKPSYSYSYIGLNMKKDVFQDINVRKAINKAINKEEILAVVLSGEGYEATSPVGKGVFGFNEELKNMEYKPAKAKQVLEGLKLKLRLVTMNNGMDIQIAELVQGYLKEVGVDVSIEILETGSYWTKTNIGDYDMYVGAWGSVTGDSDYALYPTHHSNSFGAKGNRTFFSDEKVDSLLDKARETLDEKERANIYKEIQKIIVENNSEIMLFYRDLNAGISKKIENFDLYPIPIHDYSIGNMKK